MYTPFYSKTYVKRNNVNCNSKSEQEWDFTLSERRKKNAGLTNSLVVNGNSQSKTKFPVFL